MTPGIQWKLNRHFTWSQFYSTNFVKGIGEDFITHLVRSRIGYTLDTHLSASALVQYDNASRSTGISLRFGYLFREGTELFAVYNRDKERNEFLVKFTYLFAL